MVVSLLSLPDELLLDVVSGLDRFALLALSQICRRLLYLSLSSSTYWHSDYVPAFLPVIAPIKEITAAQFREAAIRSWSTRRILMKPSLASASNNDQYYPSKGITTIDGPGSTYRPIQQIIGSRFLFKIEQAQITFWDAYTGRKVTPISQLSQLSPPTIRSSTNTIYTSNTFIWMSSLPGSLNLTSDSDSDSDSALALNISPFANSVQFERFGDELRHESVRSVCVSTNQVRIAICWSVRRKERSYRSFLEMVTVTFKSAQKVKINSTQINQVQEGNDRVDDSSSGGGGTGVEDKEIYAEFQWETPLPILIIGAPAGREVSICRCWMTQRYVVISLRTFGLSNKYVRIYDWHDPLRPSYIYHENHPESIIDVICTPYHVVFVTRSDDIEKRNNADHYIHIRLIPIHRWFPDSSTVSSSNVSVNENDGSLEEGYVAEWEARNIHFPGTLGQMDSLSIEDRFTEGYEYERNTLQIHVPHEYYFYAIGSTDTSNFDSSTFSIFIGTSPTTLNPEQKSEYYVVSISPTTRPRLTQLLKLTEKGVGSAGNPDDANDIDMGRHYFHLVDHAYQSSGLSVSSIPFLSGINSLGSLICIGEDNANTREKDEEKGATALDSHHGPYIFVYRLRENTQIRMIEDFFTSSDGPSYSGEEDLGFDAHTGIAVARGEGMMRDRIMWYS